MGTGQAGYDTPAVNDAIKVIGTSPPLDVNPKKVNRYSPFGKNGENDNEFAEEGLKLISKENSPKEVNAPDDSKTH